MIKFKHEIVPVTQNGTGDKWFLVWSDIEFETDEIDSGSDRQDKRITTQKQIAKAKKDAELILVSRMLAEATDKLREYQ